MKLIPPNSPSGEPDNDDREFDPAPNRHGQPGVPPEPRDPAGDGKEQEPL